LEFQGEKSEAKGRVVSKIEEKGRGQRGVWKLQEYSCIDWIINYGEI
jgi:hypothetical protein